MAKCTKVYQQKLKLVLYFCKKNNMFVHFLILSFGKVPNHA